ncbi:BUD3 [[Candida] subhashii]|uniref:BUD3 n=1 Tax=[Candida] subhashii TaxID=561895 RepID=A0A8J5QHX0_9ASCO|nr:BUD3 [[Candida] subhashii]KAG7663327.1 BUD3 [[Candida] subhashii]
MPGTAMSVYSRYASREHDKEYFKQLNKQKNSNDVQDITINQLNGTFDNYQPGKDKSKSKNKAVCTKSVDQWLSIFPGATFFTAYDDILFEQIITIVYRNTETEKICTASLTKFGLSIYENMILDFSSRFWPSCENLLPKYKKSNVKRALAISNLKNSSKLLNHAGEIPQLPRWDEINAGTLANTMSLMKHKTPEEIGQELLNIGLLQDHQMTSTIMDVLYDNTSSTATTETITQNNKLVNLLGEQLDQVFDPLLEYSPESLIVSYTPPATSQETTIPSDTLIIQSIIDELIQVQANYTIALVNILQDFIIPLRIAVLDSEHGLTRINQFFPPTIDEITRINCILHNSLAKANKVSYVEVIKALGIIIPYFYKAFIRHEANLKNFGKKLNKFYEKNRLTIFENQKINKGRYNVRTMNSVITGSLLELPKLKLILTRLVATIESERVGLGVGEESISSENEIIMPYFQSSIEVIDAFGGATEEDHAIDIKQRVFTPTGKILTELATNWPAELQYGWLARKVVGIYELQNCKPSADSLFNIDVMIIFSDHLLIITITDPNYYLHKDDKNDVKRLSVSDVLMHSLINEKPLPSLKSIPTMEVTCWSEINDVVITSYIGLNDADCIQVINTSLNGFKSLNNHSTKFTRNYLILNENNIQHHSHNIIKSLNKAKILHKSSPFHFFKSRSDELTIFHTAHDISVYEKEVSKSPFMLCLNMPMECPDVYFQQNPNLFLILQASFTFDQRLHITGYGPNHQKRINEVINCDDFSQYLKTTLVFTTQSIFKTYNRITRSLIGGNSHDLLYVANEFVNRDEKKLLERAKDQARLRGPVKSLSDLFSVPEVYMNKLTSKVELKHSMRPDVNTHTDTLKRETGKPDNKKKNKRKSFSSKLLKPFHKKHAEEDKPPVVQEIKQVPTPIHKENNYGQTTIPKERTIPNTFIPKGTKTEFTNTLNPKPKLKPRADSLSSQIQESKTMSRSSTVRHTPPLSITAEPVRRFSKLDAEQTPSPNTVDMSFRHIDIQSNVESAEAMAVTPVCGGVELVEVKSKEAATLSDGSALTKGENPTMKRIPSVESQRAGLLSSHNVFAKLDRDQIPLDEFYEDGKSNWVVVSLSRDNSTLSDDIKLVNKSEEANQTTSSERTLDPVQEDTEEDFFADSDIDKLKQRIAASKKDVYNKQNPSYSSIFSNNGSKNVSRRTSSYTPPVIASGRQNSRIPRELSVQSVTPSEYANELGQLMDEEFSNHRTTYQIPEEPISFQPFHRNNSVVTYNTSTDSQEEFYSPDEYSREDMLRALKLNNNSYSSGRSSDATITENQVEVKTKPINADMRDESIAQLSAILQREINFGDFELLV